jgi:hypothetical protein
MNLVDASSAEATESYQKSTMTDKTNHSNRIERIHYVRPSHRTTYL